MIQNDSAGCELGRILARRMDTVEVALARSDDKLLKIEEKLDEVDKREVKSEEILKRVEISSNRVIDVIETFTATMHQIEKTMVAMQYEIKENAGDIKDVKQSLDSVKSDIKIINERTKIDILEIIREIFSNKLTWVLSGGFLLTIILIIWKNWNLISEIKW